MITSNCPFKDARSNLPIARESSQDLLTHAVTLTDPWRPVWLYGVYDWYLLTPTFHIMWSHSGATYGVSQHPLPVLLGRAPCRNVEPRVAGATTSQNHRRTTSSYGNCQPWIKWDPDVNSCLIWFAVHVNITPQRFASAMNLCMRHWSSSSSMFLRTERV